MRQRYFLLLFFIFSVNIASLHSQNIDINILQKINHIDAGRGFDKSMHFISSSLGITELTGILGVGIVGVVKNDSKLIETGIVSGLAVGVNLALTMGIKYAVNRPRPLVAYPDIIIDRGVRAPYASFPSGHTSASFALATSLSLAYPKWYVIVPAYLWASTMAFSRMYLGLHYPSDLLGGMLLGAGTAWLTHVAKNWYLNNKQEKKSTSSIMQTYYGLSY